jgi:hypothetical protein
MIRAGPMSSSRSSLPVPGTRLTVVESGFSQLPQDAYRTAYDGNSEGWAKELAELAGYLDAA